MNGTILFLVILNLVTSVFLALFIIKIMGDIENINDTINRFINNLSSTIVYGEFNYDKNVNEVNNNKNKVTLNLYKSILKNSIYGMVKRKKENDNQSNTNYATFTTVYEFIEYLSNDNYNLQVFDIANEKVRTVKYLDNCTCNNVETVLITFDDNTEAVFFPFLFAKYYDIEEI